MPQAQAIVHTCTDFRIQKPLAQFIEGTLNLYAVDIKTDTGGIKKIFEEGPIREYIFENFKHSIKDHEVERIILINHTDCSAYGGSDAYKSQEDEFHEHEIQLRHAVSDVKARFPDKTVEAYLIVLGELNEPATVRKVI